MKSILFFVNGGLGRNIMGTAVARNIKAAYPDHRLFVSASHPAAFLGNPYVHKTIRFGVDNLYESVIQGNEDGLVVLDQEPYRDPAYLRKEEHMTQVWCRMCGVPCDGLTPDINLFRTDLKRGEAFLKRFQKPVLIFQPFGGQEPEQNTEGSYYESRLGMHRRDLDLDVAKDVVSKLKDKFVVLHVKGPNQPSIPDTMQITADVREVMALVKLSAAVLTIDSFALHTAAAFGKGTVALWAGTSDTCLGYPEHNNIVPSVCPTPACHRPNTYFGDVMPNGKFWNCPHEEICTKHDTDTIVQAVLAQLPKADKKKKRARTKSVLGSKKGKRK